MTVPPAALGPTVTLVYQYTGDSVRPAGVSASIDGVPDYCNTYTYDGQGRLVRIVQTGQPNGNAVANKQIDLAYRTDGQLATVCRYQDGQLAVEANYAYDSLGRLTGLVYHQGETVLASYDWTYSGTASPVVGSSSAPAAWAPNGGLPLVDGLPIEAGRGMLPVQDTAGVVSALLAGAYNAEMATTLVSCTSLDGTVAYTYDATGQLTATDYSGDQPDERYSYDANGNRTGAGYVVGPDNQLLSDGTYRYTYDADGNRASRFVWTDADLDGQIDPSEKSQITEYSWDARNRLAAVTKRPAADGPATETDRYYYDLENRWIGKTVDEDGDGLADHETRLVYDGNQIVLQFEGDASGIACENLSHRYLWEAAVDQVLSDEQVADPQATSDVVWPLADNLGTVRDLSIHDAQTDVTSVATHLVYDSFGNTISHTHGTLECLLAFTGLPFDDASGTSVTPTRRYDPLTATWLGEDWVGFEGNDTNLYRYFGNSPTNGTDSNGTDMGTWMGHSGYHFLDPPPYTADEQHLIDLCQGDPDLVRKVKLLIDVLRRTSVNWGMNRCHRWVCAFLEEYDKAAGTTDALPMRYQTPYSAIWWAPLFKDHGVVVLKINGTTVYLDRALQGGDDHISFTPRSDLIYQGDPRWQKFDDYYNKPAPRGRPYVLPPYAGL